MQRPAEGEKWMTWREKQSFENSVVRRWERLGFGAHRPRRCPLSCALQGEGRPSSPPGVGARGALSLESFRAGLLSLTSTSC